MVQRNLDTDARAIMRRNDRGAYTVPTNGLYPYQWNWDSAFAALGFATFDIDRAWTELETLMSGQWPNGMVPHIIFHEVDESYFPGPEVWGTRAAPASSGITQPPVVATIARSIFRRDPAEGRKRLEGLYPKLLAWHRWFRDCRCESGAAAVTHPWESGRDNAPDWDAALADVDTSRVQKFTRRDLEHVDPHMRPTKADYDRYLALVEFGRNCGWDEAEIMERGPFRVADPTTTFILLRANRDLARLAEELGHSADEVRQWIGDLEHAVEGLWNPALGVYDSLNLRTREFAGSLSSASFLCWYAGLENSEMLDRLDRVLAKVKFGVPSYDPDSPRFDRKRYWRGPSWAMMNAMIGTGLSEFGHKAVADRVREDSRRLLLTGGFSEYFDPCDGSPAGGKSFTWTAAVWLAWASPVSGGFG